MVNPIYTVSKEDLLWLTKPVKPTSVNIKASKEVLDLWQKTLKEYSENKLK